MTLASSGSDATSLCLACGFCCDGTLHTHTVLLAEEVSAATNVGLVVGVVHDKPAFPQPCTMFREGCCSIYERRPHVCRRYECALLKRTLGGEITLEQALRVVGVAQKQLGVLRGRVPNAVSFMHWLKALEAGAEAAGADAAGADATQSENQPTDAMLQNAEVSNHVVALVVYLVRHFGEGADDH